MYGTGGKRVLWYPTQAKTRLEWGTQPSVAGEGNPGNRSLMISQKLRWASPSFSAHVAQADYRFPARFDLMRLF
jgi:hypothetical protein